MRMIFSLISLLFVVAIVGFLVKKQLSTVTQLPNTAPSSTASSGNIAEQSKQVQQQVIDQLNEAMKSAAQAQQKALDGGNADQPAEKTGSAY